MANKSIGDYIAANSIDASNDYLLIQQSGVYKKINRNTILSLASAPLGTTDIQSPTNKTFDNTNTVTLKGTKLTLQDDSDITKQARFLMSSITAGNTRSYTLPDANATLVGTAATQTLTNKTLTSPTITGGTIDNSTITVDSLSGHTVATTVTVANLQIANGVLNSANAVTATSIADGAIQPKALVAGTGSGWAWASWTPVWTNLTIGNATTVNTYTQVGKTVFIRMFNTLGSTSSVSGGVTFTLPVTSVSGYNTSSILGHSYFDGSSSNPGIVLWNSTTSAGLYAINTASTYAAVAVLSSTVPFTFGTASKISAEFFYEAA